MATSEPEEAAEPLPSPRTTDCTPLLDYAATLQESCAARNAAPTPREVITGILSRQSALLLLKQQYRQLVLTSKTSQEATFNQFATSGQQPAPSDGGFQLWCDRLKLLRQQFWNLCGLQEEDDDAINAVHTILFDFVSGAGSFLRPDMHGVWKEYEDAVAACTTVTNKLDVPAEVSLQTEQVKEAEPGVAALAQAREAVLTNWNKWALGAIEQDLEPNLRFMFLLRMR